MAGGTWLAQNKVRPGAYINFKGVRKPLSNLGTRGVVTFPTAMSWGATITELLSTDLYNGESLAKIGYEGTDEQAQLFREALKNCYKAIVYRLDTGGTKAQAVMGALTAVAKYAGVLGNQVSVAVVANGSLYDVITYFKNAEKNRQTVATVQELEGNDYVNFSGTGAPTVNSGTLLTAGTNGTVVEATYTTYLNAIKAYNWNVMAIPQDSSVANTAVLTFINDLRSNFGKAVQAVLFDDTSADTEGIITTNQGYATATEIISPETFVAYAAGLTAGAQSNESNTYKVIADAISIVYPSGVTPYGDAEIISALKAGKFILSTRQDGAVVVEQDINTLHTFTPTKDYTFSKNRVIRTLDEINNQVNLIFATSYIGKVDNTDAGRTIFKADLISFLNTLQGIGAIQNFDSGTDISIQAGDTIDSVLVNLAVQPVDSMEKLYMTVNVG